MKINILTFFINNNLLIKLMGSLFSVENEKFYVDFNGWHYEKNKHHNIKIYKQARLLILKKLQQVYNFPTVLGELISDYLYSIIEFVLLQTQIEDNIYVNKKTIKWKNLNWNLEGQFIIQKNKTKHMHNNISKKNKSKFIQNISKNSYENNNNNEDYGLIEIFLNNTKIIIHNTATIKYFRKKYNNFEFCPYKENRYEENNFVARSSYYFMNDIANFKMIHDNEITSMMMINMNQRYDYKNVLPYHSRNRLINRYHPSSLPISAYHSDLYDHGGQLIDLRVTPCYTKFLCNEELPDNGVFLKCDRIGRNKSLVNHNISCVMRSNLIRNIEDFEINPDYEYNQDLILIGWNINCDFVMLHQFKNTEEKKNFMKVIFFSDFLLKEIIAFH